MSCFPMNILHKIPSKCFGIFLPIGADSERSGGAANQRNSTKNIFLSWYYDQNRND